MRLSYIHRLFFYFILIFSIFTITVIVFERGNERTYKKELIERALNSYIQIVASDLKTHPVDSLKQLAPLFPEELRLTVISADGRVLFDNEVNRGDSLENHFNRPEVVQARQKGWGEDVRESSTLDLPFLYFVKKISGKYIRVALPYNLEIRHSLEPSNFFLYSVLILFLSLLALMFLVMRRFNKSIKKLRDFIINSDKRQNFHFEFPNDELGEISRKITEQYQLLNEQKKAVDAEREKLLQHIKISKEGICFFTPQANVSFHNELFIRYLNALTRSVVTDPKQLLTDPFFHEFHEFLKNSRDRFWETQLQKQGRIFSLKVNRFEDGSFEVVLNDISEIEKTSRLKKELTGNIAHELRTPVTNIRGYLETIIEQKPDEAQKEYFIERAFRQSVLLSDLISDMSLIAKMEEGGASFKRELVDITQQIKQVQSDFRHKLEEKNIHLTWNFREDVTIGGTQSLIYSIFRNLIENSIRYGGTNMDISIDLYKEDSEFYYFSFSDAGVGIKDERHLPRIFERFYRINEGRSRDSGGTGLGLSIVKNAVLIHGGNIMVRSRTGGGLEFLFSLHK